MAEELTPEKVERMIDDAGRAEVFDRARRLGWDGDVPLWVWAQLAYEVKAGVPCYAPPQRLHEAVLGFRLY